MTMKIYYMHGTGNLTDFHFEGTLKEYALLFKRVCYEGNLYKYAKENNLDVKIFENVPDDYYTKVVDYFNNNYMVGFTFYMNGGK